MSKLREERNKDRWKKTLGLFRKMLKNARKGSWGAGAHYPPSNAK